MNLGWSWTQWLTAVALAGFLAGAASAQEPSAQPPGAQTFRAGVDLVTVRAIVKDTRGRPVTDLERDDFTLLDRGVPRPLSSFDR
jgi:hypothetical protein